MKRAMILVLIATACAAFAAPASAENGKLSGYMIGDYYYVAGNHDPALEEMNGFWLRRIYMTYDKKLEDGFSVRLRTEMSSAGDFESSSKLTPVVKDAYLQYDTGATKFLFGISGTPTWSMIEKIWGYRSVEKTALDLQKYGSSRDFGLAVKGKLGDGGKAYYHAMFANGSSNKSETNKQKKVMGAVGAWLTDTVLIEGYADYDGRPDSKNRNTLQGFIAYVTDQARLGFQLSYQNREMGEGAEDQDWTIWSVFAATRLSDQTSLFARVDANSAPNPDGDGISYLPFDESAKPMFFVGGLDFELAKNVHVMPNVEMVSYSSYEGGPEPDSDLIPRVTVYYKF